MGNLVKLTPTLTDSLFQCTCARGKQGLQGHEWETSPPPSIPWVGDE